MDMHICMRVPSYVTLWHNIYDIIMKSKKKTFIEGTFSYYAHHQSKVLFLWLLIVGLFIGADSYFYGRGLYAWEYRQMNANCIILLINHKGNPKMVHKPIIFLLLIKRFLRILFLFPFSYWLHQHYESTINSS